MGDLSRFAKQLSTVCPQLRRIRINATYFGLWVCGIGGGPALYSSKWTQGMVRSSPWFRAIRPLSSFEDASVYFTKIEFSDNCIFDLYEQDNIRTNTALVQSLFKQSATRARGAPSSGTLSPPARGLLHSALKVTGSKIDANLEFEVRL